MKKKYSPVRDVMNFLNIKDSEWLVSLTFNISETISHAIKKINKGYYSYFQGPYR